jgi:hypothetical protein
MKKIKKRLDLPKLLNITMFVFLFKKLTKFHNNIIEEEANNI